MRSFLKRRLERRLGGAWLFTGSVLAVAGLTRLALFLKSLWSFDNGLPLAGSFVWGEVFDVGAALLLSSPLVLLLLVLPAGFFERRWARALAHFVLWATLAVLIFIAAAEWFFWDEFSTRFNFIAVDYLVYTQEVIGNIRESYPMPAILAGIGLASALAYAGLLRTGLVDLWLEAPPEAFGRRLREASGWFLAALVVGFGLSLQRLPELGNSYNRELAQNGVWSFFAAFRNNELNYRQFYPTAPLDESFALVRHELVRTNEMAVKEAGAEDTLRWEENPGDELHPNIIQITVESLSGKFVGDLNPGSKLTPNLDEISGKSLVFDQCYATGTRTDRGMEALTLSLPPTPGRSIVKRPANADLFTLGSVLRTRGYDTAFIYGGYGYFDNMNAFFGGNGYRVLDRAVVAKDDVTFANAWGACDEDLFAWTLREADKSAATGRPFHYFLMTTSNHRPFTFPAGRIETRAGESKRDAAVRYTDYAIGKFIREASARPWFKNTVFVIVADHCASVAGKTELPVQNYRIPMIVHAPGGQIAPGRVKAVVSQIDLAPTLLARLHWSYPSRFFGVDAMAADSPHRAFVGNYQKLGYFSDGLLTVLKPVGQTAQSRYDPANHATSAASPDAAARALTIAYYETAARMFKRGRYTELAPGVLSEISSEVKLAHVAPRR